MTFLRTVFKEYPAISILLAAQASRDPKLIRSECPGFQVVFEEIMQMEKAIANASLQNERRPGDSSPITRGKFSKELNRMELTQAEYEAAGKCFRI